MQIFKLKNKKAPWGDYGSILVSGMTAHLERDNGLIQLERTAPYVPPMVKSGLWELCVTDNIKSKIENSKHLSVEFRPVIKKHIVEVDWTSWDFDADDPKYYPDSGEPSDYILEKPHSKELSEKIGKIWEIVINKNGTVDSNGVFIYQDIVSDIFQPDNKGYIFVSEKFKNWIDNNASDWIEFEEFRNLKV